MTSDLDSQDMSISPAAIANAQPDLEKYSTVLFNHDPDRPIGKVVSATADGMGLLCKIVISNSENDIWNKIQEGIINKFSFKGRATDFDEVVNADGEHSIIVKALEIYEVSLVSVPANSAAKTISWYISKTLEDDDMSKNKKDIVELEEGIDLTKGVVPFVASPKASEGAAWDASAAQKAVWGDGKNIADYKKIHAWYDASKPDDKGSYKLPHHNSSYDVAWRGVAAAMGALLGARGGVSIPDSDKGGVYSHLSKHYKQFGKTAPVKKSYTEDELTLICNEDLSDENLKIMKAVDLFKTTLMGEMKEIPESVQEFLDDFLVKYNQTIEVEKSKNELVEKLTGMLEKASKDDKSVLKDAITTLMKKQDSNMKEQDKKTFDFSDEKDTRPIYQINDDGPLEFSDESGKFRKQILKTGKWYHWNADGGVLNITKEILDNIVKNFKAGLLDHVTIPLTHSMNPALNTGEVLDLIQTDDGLDAVCEIKDTSVVEKIKKGLIKSISASIDPNYMNKTNGSFMGPVLLHTALVQEPFIKGMREFIQLSDEFGGRPILQFENKELTVEENLQILKGVITRLEKQYTAREDAIMTDGDKLVYEACLADEAMANTPLADAVQKCKLKLQKNMNEELKKAEEELIKAMSADEKAKYDKCIKDETDDGDTPAEAKKTCQAAMKKSMEVSKKETELIKAMSADEKAAYDKCIKDETDDGDSPAQAKKTCQAKVKKSLDGDNKTGTSKEEVVVEAPKVETTPKPEEAGKVVEESKVELSDATEVYEKFLKAGKIVPAQKDSFIKILNSKKTIDLGDGAVDIKKIMTDFLESSPKVVNFSENGTTETKEPVAPAAATDKKEMPAEVREFYTKKMDLSEEAAQKAWEEAKKRHDEENNKSTIF
jgi:HK97 family phage prohead protease